MMEEELENLSDLENLLAIAEGELFCNSSRKDSDDCEIIKIHTTAKSQPTPFIKTITNSFSVAKTRVQSSISHFFKPPKRLPDEELKGIEAKYEGWKRIKSDPFVKNNKNENKDTRKDNTNNSQVQVKKFKLPKFKLIPGTQFAVDAFSYGPISGITGYFLTHFHSDHYKGLSNKLFNAEGNSGTRLYCSEVTGNLVHRELKIRKEVMTMLKVGQIYEIEGVKVGVLDANHCPGSVMFVFGVGDSDVIKWHLHCGDFRADPVIFGQKLLLPDGSGNYHEFASDFMFESVYLDTTYAHPKHAFPPQERVIAACVDGCRKLLCGQYDPSGQKRLVPLRWMIAVGSYLIGKERIILALAEAFDLLIYADERKRSILRLLQWPELEDRLTSDPLATPLHFVSMGLMGKQKLADYRDSFQGRFSHVLGIRPTGWTFGETEANESEWSLSMPKIDGNSGVWPVPYSEHSSYKELEDFLRNISVKQVIPTVDNWADVVLDLRRVGGSTKALLYQWSQRVKRNK